MLSTSSPSSSPRPFPWGVVKKPLTDPGETSPIALLNPEYLQSFPSLPITKPVELPISPWADPADPRFLHGSKEAIVSTDHDDWTLIFSIKSQGKKSPTVGGSLTLNFCSKSHTKLLRNPFEAPGMDLTEEFDTDVTEHDDAKPAAAREQPIFATTDTAKQSAPRPVATGANKDAAVVSPPDSPTDESAAVHHSSFAKHRGVKQPPGKFLKNRGPRGPFKEPVSPHREGDIEYADSHHTKTLENQLLRQKFELMRLRDKLKQREVTPQSSPVDDPFPFDCYINATDRELASDIFGKSPDHRHSGSKSRRRRRQRRQQERIDALHSSARPPSNLKSPPPEQHIPRVPPTFLKQVQRFDQTVDSVMNTDAFNHLSPDERHYVITKFVLENEPPFQGTNQMSALLQGLMRKGMRNGSMKPATIAKLWAQSGGKLEDTPLGFEYIVNERSKAHNRTTDPRKRHSDSDNWGKPRPQLRQPRRRGQSPSPPAPKPFWSQQTRDNFARLIDSYIPKPRQDQHFCSSAQEEPEHYQDHHCCAVDATTVEEENNHLDDDSSASRHDPDSDYLPSPANLETIPISRAPFDEASVDDTTFTCVEFADAEPDIKPDTDSLATELKRKLLYTQTQRDAWEAQHEAVSIALQQCDTLEDDFLRPILKTPTVRPPIPGTIRPKATVHTKNTYHAAPLAESDDDDPADRNAFFKAFYKSHLAAKRRTARMTSHFNDAAANDTDDVGDDDQSNSSHNSDDSPKGSKKVSAIETIADLRNPNQDVGDEPWYAYRRIRIAAIRPSKESKQGLLISKTASRIYDRLTKKGSQQSLPILHHESDQVKRATAYRRWITRLYHVLLHNPFARELIDPVTFEINQDAQFPLADLEAVGMFIMSKIGERMHPYVHKTDRFDPVATLFALQQYCVPDSPSVRNQLLTEIQAFKIRDHETGTQYLVRLNQKIESAYTYNVKFDDSQIVDIALDGFGLCDKQTHRRYEAPIAQLRMMRNKESRARAGSDIDRLTLRDIERDIDEIDLRTSHTNKHLRPPAESDDRDSNDGRRSSNFRNKDRTARRAGRPDRDRRNTSYHANQVDQARVAGKRKAVKCHKCGGPHHLNKCPKIKDPAERATIWDKFYADNPSIKPNRPPATTRTGPDSSATVAIRQQTPSLKKTPRYGTEHQVQYCVKDDEDPNHHRAFAVSHQSDESHLELTPGHTFAERDELDIPDSVSVQFPSLIHVASYPWYLDDDMPHAEQEIRYRYWRARHLLLHNPTATVPIDYVADQELWFDDLIVPHDVQFDRMSQWRLRRMTMEHERARIDSLLNASSDLDDQTHSTTVNTTFSGDFSDSPANDGVQPEEDATALFTDVDNNNVPSPPAPAYSTLFNDDSSSEDDIPPSDWQLAIQQLRAARRFGGASTAITFGSDSSEHSHYYYNSSHGLDSDDASSHLSMPLLVARHRDSMDLVSNCPAAPRLSQSDAVFVGLEIVDGSTSTVDGSNNSRRTWPKRKRTPLPQQAEKEHHSCAASNQSSKVDFAGVPPIHHNGLGQQPQIYWLPDSGSTAHMTPFISDLDPGSVSASGGTVTVANSVKSNVTHRGTVTIHMRDFLRNSPDRTLTLFNVIVVPDLSRRLLSTDELNLSGHEVLFGRSHNTLKIKECHENRQPTQLTIKLPKQYALSTDGTACKWPADALTDAQRVRPTPFLIAPVRPHQHQAYQASSIATATIQPVATPNAPPVAAAAPPALVAPITVTPQSASDVEIFRAKPGKRQVGCDLMHARLGHRKLESVLLAHKAELWNDVSLKPEPDKICQVCQITLSRKANRSKKSPTETTIPGHTIEVDIIKHPHNRSVPAAYHFKYFLLIVDVASTFSVLLGLNTVSSAEVRRLLKIYLTMFRPDDEPIASQFEYSRLRKLKSDAGTQFGSQDFRAACFADGIYVHLAAPKHQESNGLCERTWQSIRILAFAFLNYARVKNEFMTFALEHAWKIFNILPIKNLVDSDGNPTTPFYLFYKVKPSVRKMRVLFCPVVAKVYDRQQKNHKTKETHHYNSSTHPQRGVPGIFVGIPRGQDGYLVMDLKHKRVRICADVKFNEQFEQVAAPTHQDFFDAVPTHSAETWRMSSSDLESTDPIDDHFGPPQLEYDEERPSSGFLRSSLFGKPSELFDDNESADDGTDNDIGSDSDDDVENATDSDSDDEDVAPSTPMRCNTAAPSVSFDPVDRRRTFDSAVAPSDDATTPVDEFLYVDPITPPRRSERVRRPKQIFDPSVDFSYLADRVFSDNADDLPPHSTAAATESAAPESDSYPCGADPSIFLPEPQSLKSINKLPPKSRDPWHVAARSEIKNLLSKGTFMHPTDYNGEKCLPVTAILKTKLRSDGMVDKLKVRIAIRGDLDKGAQDDDNSAPLASFRLLKVFLADAARHKKRAYHADFVGAYLQANMDRIVYVRLPSEWATYYSEYAEWFGVPLLLIKSAYGINSAGRLWAEELFGWFLEFGFVQSIVDPSLLYYTLGDEFIVLLSYSDDSAYFASTNEVRDRFERAMCARFDCKLLGQLHWFLQARVTQHANFDITLDQSRYAAATSARFLPNYDAVNPYVADQRKYSAPLPIDFIFTRKDLSPDQLAVRRLEEEFGFEFPVCVGCLLWLLNTYTRLQFSVRKHAKFMRLPGRPHFTAIMHTLHHIRCNHLFGLTFYSNVMDAPVARLLFEHGVDPTAPLIAFTDSSWQDCPDSGRSTGGYVLFYQGGVVDSASAMPDPVALSSAEAEYNQACVTSMAANSMAMLIQEMRGNDPDTPLCVPVLVDNQSAIAMGVSFRDTKHNRHILRRFHYVRWLVVDGRIYLYWIPGDIQLADPNTKSLSGTSPSFILYQAMVETTVPP